MPQKNTGVLVSGKKFTNEQGKDQVKISSNVFKLYS